MPYAYCEQIGKEIRDISDEIPFDIPDSWEWVRLFNAGMFISGYTPKSNMLCSKSSIPYFKVADMNTIGNEKYLSITDFYLIEPCKKVYPKNSIVYPKNGGAVFTNKRRILSQDSVVDLNTGGFYPMSALYLMYVFMFFSLIDFRQCCKGTALPTIDADKLKNTLFPIPPFSEQKRIVAKIEELLPYIEKYGKAEECITALNATFPETLKKAILQEAVQGKLVPQNPDDEPASVLLERIRAEKQELIKAGKIKRDKHESVIVTMDKIPYEIIDGKERCIADEVPFELPESWCWCRLFDIVNFIGGYAYNSSDFISSSQNQVLRLGNVKPDELKLSAKPVFISDALAEATAAFRCKTDDILLTMTGTRKKRDYFFTVRILREDPQLFINQRVGCLRAYISYMAHWLTWILKSETVLSQVFQYETGTANQGNLGAENIMKTLIPLPPLAEQHRIVAKIEEIMPMIEILTLR